MLYEGALKSAPFVFFGGSWQAFASSAGELPGFAVRTAEGGCPHMVSVHSQSYLISLRADKILQRSFAHWRRELRVKSLLLMGLPYAAEAGNRK
jgi:hypothetical protein